MRHGNKIANYSNRGNAIAKIIRFSLTEDQLGMCGRFSLTEEGNALQNRFSCRDFVRYTPRYNIAPTQPVLALINHNGIRPTMLNWGLVPYWAKDPKLGSRVINARAETVAEKPSFREALVHRRCLIPSDGFYDWQVRGGRKTPFRIVLKSREPFAFAGLWDIWRFHASDVIRSCTIITTEPTALMATIHDRMPVILSREAELMWMDNEITDTDLLTSLLVPYPSEEMEAYEVSTVVNSPRNDIPACIAPLPTTPTVLGQ